MNPPPMDLHVLLTPGLGNAAYLLASGREAVAVDPPRDAWRLVAAAEARGWRITHVVETHVHNDYLSGALELRAALGTELVLPARGRYAFGHRAADDGDVVEIDGLRLTARATPGHTPEHLAWEVATDGDHGPTAILTGGSLLVGSAGRTDLLGDDQTEALTRAQFHSLRALAGLPDEVAVLPTHGAGSFCSAGPPGAKRTTTMATERMTNPFLRTDDESAFRTALLGGLGPYPTYYGEMAAINRAGPAVRGGVPIPALMSPEAVSAVVGTGAIVVDGRSRTDFAAGHIPSRVDPKAQGSYWELASDQHLETFADVRSRVGTTRQGCSSSRARPTSARRRVLDPAIYREATTQLDRYFTISIIDCSSTMDTPVTQEVLRDLDALIVVSSPWVDGAAAAGQTMDWLAARGLRSLLQRTVIVLNDSDGHADKGPGQSSRSSSPARARRSSRCRSTGTCGPAASSTPPVGCQRPHGAVSSRSRLRSPSTSPPATTGAGNATNRSA